MYARERGIKEAKYRYILYCDDDNWLNENYVRVAYNIISNKKEIAALGGKGNITYEKNFSPPNWIKPYEKNYGCTSQGRVDGDTTYVKGCLYTAGTIIDKKWMDNLFKIGFKPSLKGRVGKSLLGGEDTELTYALKLAGGKLYYSSKMEFQHFMPSNRINWMYLKRLWFSFGFTNQIISPYNYYFSAKRFPNRVNLLFTTFKELIILYLKRFRIKYIEEGNIIDLNIQHKKGSLKALIFNFGLIKHTVKTVELLQNNRSKDNNLLYRKS